MPVFPRIFEQSSTTLLTLISLIFTFILVKHLLKTSATKKRLPPSPLKIPIIGHLHKLGSLPHRSLHALSQKYGPLMLLHLGSVPTLVVSSAEGAREIMKPHDLVFADRPKSVANEKLLYNYKDVSMSPYSEYWRQMKSFCVIQLLSNKKVHDFKRVREDETALLVKKIAESSSAVDLSDLFMMLTNNVVFRAAFGKKTGEGESGRQLRKLLKEFVYLLGGFDVGSFIPWLAWINTVSGLYAKLDKVAKEFDTFLEGIVNEHMASEGQIYIGEKDVAEDFVDVLLGVYKDNNNSNFAIDRDSIKAIILDMVAGGTDTSYTVLEWVMTELLRHPKAMKCVQEEVRKIGKGKSEITEEEDFEKMPYLKAVIKETLRLHPPIPLLVPRVARQDVKFMSYDVAAGTMVIINAWAIGRDPSLWDEPEEFRPDRFLNSSIDFKGHDFQLIPFGAGRRGCPGIAFAMATNELVLANLLYRFDWELPNGIQTEDLDMNEGVGITIHRQVPLLAVATPCST